MLGTLNNCASGQTPWGTYLSGEENWAGYFDGGDNPTADQRRWGLRKTGWYRWAEHDERFDARKHPNEFHRFGWVVEIDPMDPTSTPVKRTALGRAAHEGAWVGGHEGRPRGGVFGRGRALRVHLQVRQPRPHRARRRRHDGSAGQRARCWTTARCTWRASTPTAAAAGCRWCTARAR